MASKFGKFSSRSAMERRLDDQHKTQRQASSEVDGWKRGLGPYSQVQWDRGWGAAKNQVVNAADDAKGRGKARVQFVSDGGVSPGPTGKGRISDASEPGE